MSDLTTSSVSTETSGLNFNRISTDSVATASRSETIRVGSGAQQSTTTRALTADRTSSRVSSQKISIGYELSFSIPLESAGLYPTQPGQPC